MNLCNEILLDMLKNENITVKFENINLDFENAIEQKCYSALCKIKNIVEDDSLDDKECFKKIEQIVCALEFIGSSGGTRHDF